VEDNRELTRMFTMAELEVIKEMKTNTAPGPGGFQSFSLKFSGTD